MKRILTKVEYANQGQGQQEVYTPFRRFLLYHTRLADPEQYRISCLLIHRQLWSWTGWSILALHY